MSDSRYLFQTGLGVEARIPLFDNGDGTYSHNLSPDFIDRVALGRVPGVTRTAAFGYNPNVGTAASISLPQDIHIPGGAYPWMTGATSLEIGYLSGGDVGRTVRVSGIDFLTRAAISEDALTNGTNFVPLTKQFYRINSARSISTGVNPNDIVIRDAGGGTVRAVIPAGFGTVQQSQYTVPANSTLLILTIEVALNAESGVTNRSLDAATWFQSSTGVIVMPRRINATSRGPTELRANALIPLVAQTDFQLRVIRCDANSTAVTGAWEGLLFGNLLP